MWAKITTKARVILSLLAVYISVTGLVTFSLFITEESIQMSVFGSWPAQDAKDWQTVHLAYRRIIDANKLLKTINYSIGWIQPLAFLGYRSYGQSTDVYIKGLEAKIFANAPELFDGREITVSFIPQEVRVTPDGYLHVNRRVSFLSKEKRPASVSCRITGLVSVQGNKVVITEAEM
jgi:hypothetical protein